MSLLSTHDCEVLYLNLKYQIFDIVVSNPTSIAIVAPSRKVRVPGFAKRRPEIKLK